MYYIIAAAAAIVSALAFIALGMRIANENNKRAWEKYYEGQRSKDAKYTAQYTADVVPLSSAKHKAR
jgi:hypothetical protein